MLLDLKVHVLKLEKLVTRKQLDNALELPEFKVRVPFPDMQLFLTHAIQDCFTGAAFNCPDVTRYPCICHRSHTTHDGVFSALLHQSYLSCHRPLLGKNLTCSRYHQKYLQTHTSFQN
jgi:hypothetical protein